MRYLTLLLILFVACNKKTDNNTTNTATANTNADLDNYFTINSVTYYRDIQNSSVSCSNTQSLWGNFINGALGNSLAISPNGTESIILIDVIINNSKTSYICRKKPKLVSKNVNGHTTFEFTNSKFYENNTTDTSNIIYASGKLTCK